MCCLGRVPQCQRLISEKNAAPSRVVAPRQIGAAVEGPKLDASQIVVTRATAPTVTKTCSSDIDKVPQKAFDAGRCAFCLKRPGDRNLRI